MARALTRGATIGLVLALAIALSGAPAAQAQRAAEETPVPAGAPLETLVEVLRDDAARTVLLEELESRLAEDEAGAEAEPEPAPAPVSLGGRIAEFSQAAAEAGAASLRAAWERFRDLPTEFGALGRADLRTLGTVLGELGLLALVSYGLFYGGRRLVGRLRLGARAGETVPSWPRRAAFALVLFLLDLVLMVFAWGAGYAVALALFGALGRIGIHHSLFLNAFLAVTALVALSRAILAPGRPDLRLIPLADARAHMLAGWLRLAFGVLVFGQFLLVPVFNRNVSSEAGHAVSVTVYVLVLALLANLVLRLREPVARAIGGRLEAAHADGWAVLARQWHVPVLAYLLVLVVVVLFWSDAVMGTVLLATLKVACAVALGLFAAGLITRLILLGVRVPSGVSRRIPLLEKRLNSFVPHALTALRALVTVVVVAVTLDAVGLVSVTGWLASELGTRVSSAVLAVLGILIAAFAGWLLVTSWVDFRLQGAANNRARSRERTLLVLFRNAATILIVVIALMVTLSEVGLDITPLLASAGVIGLAIGFGAQRLVQDIITGIFIQFEGAIDVGDVVTIGGISGTVERLTIRSAGLRDSSGVYHVVPFSSVSIVSNFMRGFAYAVIDMSVPASERLDLVQAAMAEAYERLHADPLLRPDLVEPRLDFLGIDKFVDDKMVVRGRIKTMPGRQWAVTRAYNGLVKAVFEERLIGREKPAPSLPPAGEAAGDAEHALAEEMAREAGARSAAARRGPRAPETPDSPAGET